VKARRRIAGQAEHEAGTRAGARAEERRLAGLEVDAVELRAHAELGERAEHEIVGSLADAADGHEHVGLLQSSLQHRPQS
jgi:hypothetical protein